MRSAAAINCDRICAAQSDKAMDKHVMAVRH
jgi:hypothetical protein